MKLWKPEAVRRLAAHSRTRVIADRAITLAVAIEGVLRRVYRRVWRSMSPPVTVHRSKHRITVAEAPRVGGRVHVFAVDGASPTSVQQSGKSLLIGANPNAPALAVPFADESVATAALMQIRKALLPTSWFTWGKRAAAFLLLVMLFNATARVVFGSSAEPQTAMAATPPVGMAAALADSGYVPPENNGQVLPGGAPDPDLAFREAQAQVAQLFPGVDVTKDTPQARQALAAMERQLGASQGQGGGGGAPMSPVSAPPVESANVMPGLKGFGLQGGPGDGGPGCDPALAYKVGP